MNPYIHWPDVVQDHNLPHVYLAVCPAPRMADPPLPRLLACGPPFPTWLRGIGGCMSAHAVVGGAARDGTPALLGRAEVDHVMMPVRVDPQQYEAYAACGDTEHYIRGASYEVLVLPRGRAEWVEASDGDVPAHAFPVCPMPSGETAFFARVHHDGAIIPGRLLESEGGCVITHEGRVLIFRSYEALAIM